MTRSEELAALADGYTYDVIDPTVRWLNGRLVVTEEVFRQGVTIARRPRDITEEVARALAASTGDEA